jgi:hypothetical protein
MGSKAVLLMQAPTSGSPPICRRREFYPYPEKKHETRVAGFLPQLILKMAAESAHGSE